MRRIAIGLLASAIALGGMSCATDTEEPEATAAPQATPDSEDIQAATPEATEAEGDVTRDGRHPVYIRSVDVEERTISVDSIQWLTGDDAADAYYSETGERGGPPNDYFIKNDEKDEQTLDVSEDAEIKVANLDEEKGEEPNSTDLESATLEELADYVEDHEGSPFWIEVSDEVAEKIEEQYVP